MNKRIVGFISALTCAACIIPCCAVAVAETTEGGEAGGTAQTTVWEGQEAIFLKSVKLEKTGGNHVFSYTFDKDVSTQSATVEDAKKKLFLFNGTALDAISDASVAYDAENAKQVKVTVPDTFFKEGETIAANVLGGFVSASDRVTTVRYSYEFAPSATTGKRVYREESVSEYDEIHITSISTPTTESGNFTFKVFFSDSVTPKKYIDMQSFDNGWLKGNYGESAKNNPTSYHYTDAELDLLYAYQVYGSSNEYSLSHKLTFGCTSMNGLQPFFANTSGLDMTPKATVKGIQAFSVRQLQEAVAQEGISYSSDGETFRTFNGSTQVLSVQIHFESNFIQFVLKGDSPHDKDFKPVKTRRKNASGGYDVQDITSFNENLAPDRKQNMVFGLMKGMLLPNGKAIHKDDFFFYDYEKGSWIAADELTDTQTSVDETVANQNGYTAGELITYNKKKK